VLGGLATFGPSEEAAFERSIAAVLDLRAASSVEVLDARASSSTRRRRKLLQQDAFDVSFEVVAPLTSAHVAATLQQAVESGALAETFSLEGLAGAVPIAIDAATSFAPTPVPPQSSSGGGGGSSSSSGGAVVVAGVAAAALLAVACCLYGVVKAGKQRHDRAASKARDSGDSLSEQRVVERGHLDDLDVVGADRHRSPGETLLSPRDPDDPSALVAPDASLDSDDDDDDDLENSPSGPDTPVGEARTVSLQLTRSQRPQPLEDAPPAEVGAREPPVGASSFAEYLSSPRALLGLDDAAPAPAPRASFSEAQDPRGSTGGLELQIPGTSPGDVPTSDEGGTSTRRAPSNSPDGTPSVTEQYTETETTPDPGSQPLFDPGSTSSSVGGRKSAAVDDASSPRRGAPAEDLSERLAASAAEGETAAAEAPPPTASSKKPRHRPRYPGAHRTLMTYDV